MATMFWQTGILLLLVFGRVTCDLPDRVSSSGVCSVPSVADSVLRSLDLCTEPYSLSDGDFGGDFVGVTEGDEVSLQRALNLVHNNSHEYVSLLFYASWCPFSRSCRPTFAFLSSLYPFIRHFAVEESAIRPSILSSDVTGIKLASRDRTSLEKNVNPSDSSKLDDIEQESCPFSWARSPEHLLRQETYLALATIFVLLRLMYFLLPTLLACARYTWRRHIQNASLVSLCKHPFVYLYQAVQAFNVLKEPCKRSNLQGGARNASMWASKSLASVSIGDASSSRGYSGNERR